MLPGMVMARLDPSPWNLGAPLLALAACGPLVPFDEGETDSSATESGNDTQGPGSNTNPGTTNPGTTNPGTTMTTSSPQCNGPEDCPPGYSCSPSGYCYYDGYCNDGTCCSPECGWYYECFSNWDCPVGYSCQYNNCNPIEAESECAVVSLDAQIPIPLAGGVMSLAFMDDDGDAQRDLVVGRTGSIQVVDGATLAVTDILVADIYPWDIVTGDVDGDGDQDIVWIDGGQGGSMRVNLNDGAWSTVNVSGSAQSLQQIELADIDGDGRPEIYGVSSSNGTFVAFNDGVTPFSNAEYVFDASSSLAVGNLDDDGQDDAVLHSYSTYALLGGLSFELYGFLEQTGREQRIVTAGNFNGGSPDDVITLQGINGITIASAFVGYAPSSYPYLTYWSWQMERAETADINGDGFDDVIGAGAGTPLMVAYASSIGGVDLVECVQYVNPPLDIYMLASGDMTGDGVLDVAVSNGDAIVVMTQMD